MAERFSNAFDIGKVDVPGMSSGTAIQFSRCVYTAMRFAVFIAAYIYYRTGLTRSQW
jgi:hypothetical protein